jgi:hypothetical protein
MGIVNVSHPARLLTVTKTNFASALGAITSNAMLYPTKGRKGRLPKLVNLRLVYVLFDGEPNRSPPSTSRIFIARKANTLTNRAIVAHLI